MLSWRFFQMVKLAVPISLNCGAIPLEFDEKQMLFHISSNPKYQRRMKYTYTMLALWVFWGYLLIPKYWYEQNVERYNVTLFYCLGATAIVADCISPTRWHTEDVCRQVNGFIHFMKYFQGK